MMHKSRRLLPLLLKCFSLVCLGLAMNATPASAQRRRRPPATPQPPAQQSQPRKPAPPTGQPTPTAGQPQASQVPTAITIRWRGQPGIDRYRLQVSRDEAFSDIVFDRAVTGREQVVTGLAGGEYFWRVAPAAVETGAYTTPAPVGIVEGSQRVVMEVLSASDDVGWRTATGEVAAPVPVQLRAGGQFDLIAVNTDGQVYALDGANGVAMWTARYKPNARRGEPQTARFQPLTPLVLRGATGALHVIVGMEGGVRALRGDTGIEVWKVALAGRAVSGVATDLNGDGATEAVVVTNEPAMLYVLDGSTGRMFSGTKLDAPAIGAPFPYLLDGKAVVAMSLNGGALDLRDISGALVRGIKLNAGITTAPLIIAGNEKSVTGTTTILLVGTEQGLVAFDAKELRPLGRIVTDNDMPHGKLTAKDLDGDGTLEIIMVTKRGRVAVADTTDGKIRWFAEGATDAAAAEFADLNADGVLDVIVPAGTTFALGFSGADGALLWRADESGKPSAQPAARTIRSLSIAPVGDAGLIYGSDPSRVNIRAVGLPKGAIKSASK